jgi:beta-glucosidase
MKLFFLLALLCSLIWVNAQPQPLYKNPKATIEQRVNDLLQRMTIKEKAGQLNQINGGAFTGPAMDDAGQKEKVEMTRQGRIGSFLNVVGVADTRVLQKIAVEETRLGIPLLFAYDVIHGYKTIFPIPLAEACSWNLAEIEKNSQVAALEAASAGIHWTFAPMADVSSDARWGRVLEGAGEDPYLCGLVTAARVRGLQGNLNTNQNIMACVKHFAAYGSPTAGREYNDVNINHVSLWNNYLPSYKKGLDAGAATIMNSFNTLDNVPASANKYLVSDILLNQWKFKGFVVSDWASFNEMIAHGYAADNKDAAAKALSVGSMMDMESKAVEPNLEALIKEKKVKLKQIDDYVRRILYYKFKLGLFDDPYKYNSEEREKQNIFTAANRLQARKAASESIVLLKNENNILPLAKNKSIALIGRYANSNDDMFDFWVAQGKSSDAINTYQGLQAAYSNISFATGYEKDTITEASIKQALDAAKNAEVIVIQVGLSGKMAGEDRALVNPIVSHTDMQLVKALYTLGKPIVAVVAAGRPIVMSELAPYTQAIVYTWILGTEHGNALADVLTGAVNPSAKTVMSFPYAIGQIPISHRQLPTGRTCTDVRPEWCSRYRDAPTEPLYPFGYGLSYTNFTYENPTVTVNKRNVSTVVQVTNAGDKDGYEVVQVYIHDVTANIVQPTKKLVAYERVFLKAGETKTLQFKINQNDLSYYNGEGKVIFEPGKFVIMVGGNSRDVISTEVEIQ